MMMPPQGGLGLGGPRQSGSDAGASSASDARLSPPRYCTVAAATPASYSVVRSGRTRATASHGCTTPALHGARYRDDRPALVSLPANAAPVQVRPAAQCGARQQTRNTWPAFSWLTSVTHTWQAFLRGESAVHVDIRGGQAMVRQVTTVRDGLRQRSGLSRCSQRGRRGRPP